MNLLNTKVVLSALGIVAVLASPAFAQKRQHVTHVNQTDESNVVPGYDVSRVVPGYSKDGATVGKAVKLTALPFKRSSEMISVGPD